VPKKRDGYTQVPFEMPDGLHAAARAAAERDGLKFTQWVCAACAARAGVEYVPPKLGRRTDEEKRRLAAKKKPARKRGGKK